MRPASFVMSDTPVEVQFTSAGCLNYPCRTPRVTVTLADGHTVQRMRYYASGTPQAPLTKEQVEEKFFLCAERAVDNTAATKIFSFLNQFEGEPSLAELWTLLKRG